MLLNDTNVPVNTIKIHALSSNSEQALPSLGGGRERREESSLCLAPGFSTSFQSCGLSESVLPSSWAHAVYTQMAP